MKFVSGIACLCLPLLLLAGEKWAGKDYSQWTAEDAGRVLDDSPWVKHAQAYLGTTDEDARTYPVQAPTPREAGLGGRSASDGNWDGGVGRMNRGTDPTLPVIVRWDSALPVRQALLRSHAAGVRDTENTLSQPDKYYVIAILGLAPARKSPVDSSTGDDIDRDQFEMTRTRQGLLNQARLMRRDKKAIVPEDARIDPSTGTVQIFFPKTDPIAAADKEVTFGTMFGTIRVTQKFRLKDMMYRGKLEL